MTRTWRIVVLVVAVSAVAAQSASAKTKLGFTDDPWRIEEAAPAVEGVSDLARIPVNWTGVQAAGWEVLDGPIAAARASGQRLMLTVYGTENPDLGQWQSFLRDLRARYPDLWAVQAWNEPNLRHIGGGLPVGRAAAIVRAAKRALPGVRIVGPGVSPTVRGASRYQTKLYRRLPRRIGVAVNIYTYRKRKAIPDVLAQYRKAKRDGGGAKVYVTEFGFHAAYFRNQAKFSAKGFEALRRKRAAAVIFYRLLRNPDPAVPKWERTGRFHVLNDDLRPRPILKALARANRRR